MTSVYQPSATAGYEIMMDQNLTETMRRRDSVRSMSSYTTDWSCNTEPVSNTTASSEDKKRSKGRFLHFTKVLLKFLDKKNPAVSKSAREVIRECEEKKNRGDTGFESLSESIRAPLKEVVGSPYWKEAKRYLNDDAYDGEADDEADYPCDEEDEQVEPISLTETPLEITEDDLNLLKNFLGNGHQNQNIPSTCLMHNPPVQVNPIKKEKKLRQKRFWMLIRVLMKYLKQEDPSLYIKARLSIQTCVERQKIQDRNYRNLMENVQKDLKRLVGIRHWRKAESYLSRILLHHADDIYAEKCSCESLLVPAPVDI